MPPWETVLGLEVHIQLNTRSKLFSGSRTAFGAPPNTQANFFDAALPGVLPTLNQAAVEKAIRLGLALDARISRYTVFSRKNYFYPDLPKGYQTSQWEAPIIEGGQLAIEVAAHPKTIRIARAHLEEDAGKSLHGTAAGVSGIDLNRAGTPLLEVVSEPDLRSAEEAVAYARALYRLVTWLDLCDGNLQEGSFRMDLNVSLRPPGTTTLGTRCEIKNVNSFKFAEKAIAYEIRRQQTLLEMGKSVVQQTRLYDAVADETRAMRSKEDAHDYRYFPDPDLLPLPIQDEWIEQIRLSLPELPDTLRLRLQERHALSRYDATQITASRALAAYFEDTVQSLGGHGKLIANWLLGELLAQLNRENTDISQCPVSPARIAGLLRRVADQTISGKNAKEVLNLLWHSAEEADAIIAARGFQQFSDAQHLKQLINDVLSEHPGLVEQYRNGKEKVLGALIGHIMKRSQGQASPTQLQPLLKACLHSDH